MSSQNERVAPPPGERFKRTLISLANIICREIDSARKRGFKAIDGEILKLGISLIEVTDGDVITGGFITRSFGQNQNELDNYWDKILTKNDEFFLDKKNSSSIFGELSDGIIEGFIQLIKNNQVNKNLMTAIWEHLHAMVKISISFVFQERIPVRINSDEGFFIKYTNMSRPHINLENEAKKWNVNLQI